MTRSAFGKLTANLLSAATLFGVLSTAQIIPAQIIVQSAPQTLALSANYQADWFTYSD